MATQPVWLQEARKRIPELDAMVFDNDFENEYALWLELESAFDDASDRQKVAIYEYANWSIYESPDPPNDIATACACCFIEHQVERQGSGVIMAKLFPRDFLEEFDYYIRYHASPERVEEFRQEFQRAV